MVDPGMSRVLVTGASGFIGSALCRELAVARGTQCLGSVRRTPDSELPCAWVKIGELGPSTDWQEALRDVTTVVHTAARVHVMAERAEDPLAAYRAANVEGTVNLAKQAAAAGVERFVYLSSIKVNGESTRPGRPFRASDEPAPADPYGHSKLEAERALREIGTTTGMAVVIVRPPLVYGPGVKANFRALAVWAGRGLPLPLAAVKNKRSFVSVANLVDLLATCVNHPAAADQTFLVSDGEDLSTADLFRRLARVMNRKPRLVPVPESLLWGMARLLRRERAASRLLGSLQVDMTHTRNQLQWSPPISVDEGLRGAVAGWVR